MKRDRIIWLYGFSGAGKTTIADSFVKGLRTEDIDIIKLEGEDIREIIPADIGYSLDERKKIMDMTHKLANHISKNDVLSIVCTVTPPLDYNTNITKVHIKCPVKTCIERDVKGLYKKASEGLVDNIYGLDLEYPEIKNCDIVLDTDKHTIFECVNKLHREIFWNDG